MKHIYFIPMCWRDAITVKGDTEDAHRGVFFYDPAVFPQVEIGDEIEFICHGALVVNGIVSELLNTSDFPYSKINDKGFRYE